jgi:hypothetical protein
VIESAAQCAATAVTAVRIGISKGTVLPKVMEPVLPFELTLDGVRTGGRAKHLQTLDRDSSVFYAGTFSKCMFAALRKGFIAAPAWAYAPLIDRWPRTPSNRSACRVFASAMAAWTSTTSPAQCA